MKLIMASWKAKLILIVLIAVVGFGAYKYFGSSKTQATQYQTEQSQKGTLIVSVSASGQVASTNSSQVETQATGVVNKVMVKDGDTVKSGQVLATIDLDQSGKQKAAQALSSYQNAKSSLESAKANLYSLQSKMFAANQKFINDAVARDLVEGDPTYIQQDADWLASEALYKNQQNAINQAQSSLNSAWLSYQQSSATIYAPISGKVSGLSLQPGTVINTTSNSSGNASATKIANVLTNAEPTISISLTEIDIPKVKIGDKATVTFDSFPDKTFTGSVVSIDVVGGTTSGVTTYPVLIKLDTQVDGLFSNMAANASIITETKDNVVLVPISAVKTTDGQKTVQVMNNGQIENKTVETGLTSDTQIEIVSGLNEGEEVVTSVISTGTQSTSNRSVFSTIGGSGGARTGGGTGANRVRIGG